jgi:predicted TIM-barrel fold metal-dependent hydrolase
MGIEKVIFSVDYPYVSNVKAREFLDAAPIGDRERRLIASENVRKLLKL